MDREHIKQLLISILRSELTQTVIEEDIKKQILPDIIPRLYSMANAHDLAHMVSTAIKKIDVKPNGDTAAALQKQEMLAIYRSTQLQYELTQLCDAFDDAKIMYIPLKGSVMRAFYPYDSMRTSCDVDVLVKTVDFERASLCLEKKLNAKKDEAGEHDVAYILPSGVHIELHFALIEGDGERDIILEHAWEYAVAENNCRFRFTDEFFLYYHVLHMAKHFKHGGCGIRPFMDLWIIENSMNIDRHSADMMLEQAGLRAFSNGAFKLSDCWFNRAPYSKLTSAMEDYIIDSGVYGSVESRIAIERTRHSKIGYILNRIFLPYSNMTTFFPILRNAPILLPFCWMIRIFKVLFNGRAAVRIMEASKSLTSESNDELAFIVKSLEL